MMKSHGHWRLRAWAFIQLFGWILWRQLAAKMTIRSQSMAQRQDQRGAELNVQINHVECSGSLNLSCMVWDMCVSCKASSELELEQRFCIICACRDILKPGLWKLKLTKSELWMLKLNDQTQTARTQAYNTRAVKAHVKWPNQDGKHPKLQNQSDASSRWMAKSGLPSQKHNLLPKLKTPELQKLKLNKQRHIRSAGLKCTFWA